MIRPAVSAWRAPRTLDQCHNIDDLRWLAYRHLPGPIFHFLDGAAESEISARKNVAGFDNIDLVPRCLVDVTCVNTATSILGQEVAWPLFCSPTGGSRIFHPDGEAAVARAAGQSGIYFGLSTNSTLSLEEVAAAATGPKLFQLYIFKDRGLTRELIERCKRARFTAMCLTVDVPVIGKRERDLRTGFGVPIQLSARLLGSFLCRPAWSFRHWRSGALSIPNLEARAGSRQLMAQMRYIGQQLDASVAWKDVREMIELWGGPFALKGVLAADDARRAIDVGATAVIVSNHGGRQLDGAVAPIDALPKIVDAVGQEIEVLLDGGVRRGSHVLKALARGARACSIGRPYLYGLAAAGEQGVKKALDILKAELVRSMQLAGCTDVTSVSPDLLANK
jgi:L-lactate dehydrogenase (cytochrome)